MASTLSFNIGGLKAPPGMLKFFETILGAISLGLMLDDQAITGSTSDPDAGFVYIVIFAFLVTTLLLLVSTLMYPAESNMIQKTVFEFLYHLLAFILCFTSSVNFLVCLGKRKSYVNDEPQSLAIGIIVLINSILYLLSTYMSYKLCRSS